MTVLLIFALVVAGSVVVALAAMLAIRARVSLAALEAHTEVAGYAYNTISVLHSVLIGFTVLIVWTQYQGAGSYLEAEANALVEVYRLSAALDPADRQTVRAAVVSYIRTVIDDEWPAIERNQPVPESSQDRANELWAAFSHVSAKTSVQQASVAESFARLSAFGEARRGRIYEIDNIVPGMLWAAMGLGAVFVIFFPVFFGVKKTWAQGLITIAITSLITASLLVIFTLDAPFSGTAAIPPAAFVKALGAMDRIDRLP